MEIEKSHKNKDKWHNNFYPVVWSSRILAYSMWCRSNGQGLHSTLFKWSNDQLEYHGSLYLNNIPLWGISTLWSLSHLTQKISNEHRSKDGIATYTRARVASPTRTQDKNEHTKAAHWSYNSEKCSNLYHSELDVWMRSLSVLGCSRDVWCTVSCA
jgi:hypothetical protein